MYLDTVDVITGGDDTLVEAAIDGAVSEAKSYLSDYDTPAIFSATGSNRHPLLVTFCKDLAVWHLVVLSNYHADIELREKRYNRAIEWLKSVQSGKVVPDLPRSTDSTGPMLWGSNPKRSQHY